VDEERPRRNRRRISPVFPEGGRPLTREERRRLRRQLPGLRGRLWPPTQARAVEALLTEPLPGEPEEQWARRSAGRGHVVLPRYWGGPWRRWALSVVRRRLPDRPVDLVREGRHWHLEIGPRPPRPR
jgi:hypothetical protein